MQIISDLRTTCDETLRYFNLDNDALSKTYAPGKWTILQILHHLADAEAVLCERIKRGIAEKAPVVFLFGQDEWNDHLRYPEMPLSFSKNIYQAVREQLIYLAEQFYASHGNNNFFQHNVGLRTVKEEFDKVVWHNEKHLAQIRTALGN